MAQTVQSCPAASGPEHETACTRNSNHNWPIARGLYTSAFTQFERDLIAERVKSGVANYRKKNPNKKWGGRKSNLTPETAAEILKLKNEGVGIRKLSKQFSVSINTIYKVINEEMPIAA